MAEAPRGRSLAPATRELLRRLGVGALLLVAAAWLFGAIAEDVATSDRLTVLDVEVARWLRTHATPARSVEQQKNELLRAADSALYSAKERGKDRCLAAGLQPVSDSAVIG